MSYGEQSDMAESEGIRYGRNEMRDEIIEWVKTNTETVDLYGDIINANELLAFLKSC